MFALPRPVCSDSRFQANEKAVLLRRDWVEHMVGNNPEQRSGAVGITAFEPWWILKPAQP